MSKPSDLPYEDMSFAKADMSFPEFKPTLRDYYAGLVVAGLIATRHPHHNGEEGLSVLAQDTFLIVDELLTAREQVQ